MTEEMSFQVSLENCQGFSIPDGVGSSFHQSGTGNENVPESDFVPLWWHKISNSKKYYYFKIYELKLNIYIFFY